MLIRSSDPKNILEYISWSTSAHVWSEFMDHRVCSLSKRCQAVFQSCSVNMYFFIHTVVHESSHCSTGTRWKFCLKFSPSGGWLVVSCCGFNLHFPGRVSTFQLLAIWIYSLWSAYSALLPVSLIGAFSFFLNEF